MYYKTVRCPPSAPSKTDHGDIDLIAAEPFNAFPDEELVKALEDFFRAAPGSVRYVRNGKVRSFAVPHPYMATYRNIITFGGPSPSSSPPKPLPASAAAGDYFQIDLHVCGQEDLDWELLHCSYGDLMQILGVMNKYIGLTCNDHGLHVRIPEIEKYDKKKSMIFLTNSPRKVMEFLGLDPSIYYASPEEGGFRTNDDIFRWCASGRFYYNPSSRNRDNETSNDRQRYKKREMFRSYMNDWYPTHQDDFSSHRQWTREEVLEEALSYFPHARVLYHKALARHERIKWEAEILRQIKEFLPVKDKKKGEVVRAVNRFVIWNEDDGVILDNGSGYDHDITERARWMPEDFDLDKIQEVIDFVKENWSVIHALEVERLNAIKALEEERKAAAKALEEERTIAVKAWEVARFYESEKQSQYEARIAWEEKQKEGMGSRGDAKDNQADPQGADSNGAASSGHPSDTDSTRVNSSPEDSSREDSERTLSPHMQRRRRVDDSSEEGSNGENSNGEDPSREDSSRNASTVVEDDNQSDLDRLIYEATAEDIIAVFLHAMELRNARIAGQEEEESAKVVEEDSQGDLHEEAGNKEERVDPSGYQQENQDDPYEEVSEEKQEPESVRAGQQKDIPVSILHSLENAIVSSAGQEEESSTKASNAGQEEEGSAEANSAVRETR
jgi:hypothetical protein